MKRSTLLVAGCAIASILLFAACGGGGTSKPSLNVKSYPENEVLGNAPNILFQFCQKDSIISNYYDNELREIRDEAEKVESESKLKKLYEKYDLLDAEEEAELDKLWDEKEAAIEKEKAKLIGKEIPFEIEEGTWYDITDLTITNFEKGYVSIVGTIKVKDEEQVNKPNMYYYPIIPFICLDSQGNEIYKNCNSNQNSKRDENLVFKSGFDLRHDTGRAFLDFAKIRFLNKN